MLQNILFNRLKNLLCSLVLGSLSLAVPAAAQTSHWLTGYYATYNYGVMSTSQLDYTKLTHVIYWPVIPSSSAPGTLITTPFGISATTFANGATDIVARAHSAGAKALIGIGGDQSSGATAGFQISTTPTYQATFINNIVALMQQYGFDGVDINWEQIQTSDNSDFTSFIANLRAALTTASPNTHLLLTMPPETKPNGGRPDLLSQVYQDLDQINIQTYQMSGPYCGWETWYNSPLNNGGATFILVSSEQLPSITNAIADYTSLGIPQSKLAMGIQFDSSVWTGGQGTSTGGVTQPKQTWTGDSTCSSSNPDAPSYSTLPYRQMITTLAVTNGYTTNFDSTADQSWLSYDPSGSGSTNESKDSFVSYDSPTSIAKKGVDLSPSAGVGSALGGAFIFELSGDFAATASASQQHPLLNAAHAMQMLLPGLVTNLKATAATASATLTWTAANGATSYNVFYSTSATGATTAAPSVTTTQATISNLTPGQEYWFEVQPVNTFGNGVVSSQVTATIPNQTVPTVIWLTPASIPYGTPLSYQEQLDATASVPGTFVYTPGEGTVLSAGTHTLSVTFTPTSSSYSVVTKTVSLVVNAATLSTSNNFGSVEVPGESNAHAITLYFTAADTIASIQTLTMGATGQDFVSVPGGTCVVGTAYPAGGSCTVLVTFTPQVTGTRRGAVIVTNNTTSWTTFLTGAGTGPQITFDPGTASVTTTSEVIAGMHIAMDGSSNLFYTYPAAGSVMKVTSSGTRSTYVSGLGSSIGALAVDGAGNLYIALPGKVYMRMPSGGVGYIPVGGATDVASAIAIDPTTGNRYIADSVTETVYQSAFIGGGVSTFLSGSVLGKNLNGIGGLAVDGSGSVYVSDTGNNRVLKIQQGTASLFGAGNFNAPYGIALGGSGDVFVAESHSAVVELTKLSYKIVPYRQSTLGTDVLVDGYENLLVSASAVDGTQDLIKITRSTPSTISFAATAVGSTSSDSPKTLTITDMGTDELNFPPPGDNVSGLTTGFNLANTTNCADEFNPGTAQTSLQAGASCNYAINFSPTTVGAYSGSLTLLDNSLNVATAEQVTPLTGTGTEAATVTLSGLSATYTGSPIAVKATTVPAGLTVSITYAGSTTAPTKAGSYAVVATVTSTGYTGSATGTLVIAKATPVITWPTPAPIVYGTVLSATQLDAKANVPGSFVYSPAAGTTPPVGTDTLNTTFTPTDATDYTTATAKVSLVVTAATNPRVVWIPDFYGGLLQVRVGTTPTAITINLPSCNPNAVAVNNNKAYVVCNAYGANPDKILVYNATTIRAAPAGTLTISPLQTITSSQFNSLIGITFDASNNLWVASYGNNQVDSISAATLNTANPVVTASLIDSPSAPVSLAFDSSGGLWVVGQYVGGILLHFPSSQINGGENATPDYCMATANVGAGCQYIDNVFLSPEGVALYNGDVWVANNSTGATGTVPGRELVDLKFSNGTLTVNETFGTSGVPSSAPFVCPGGLYGSTSHLWVNDESYAESNPACGANGDVASKTGGVFSFTPAQLAAKTTTISQVLAFSNITGRPGFGGIFVEND
jgi:GH18 family chitinase/sugar lactone lactonase YvrE